jgi:hypothetical protein
MDLRQCLILISGHLTSLSNSGALAESTVIVPNENISFGSTRQQPMPMREQGIASPGEQAAAAPEKVSSSLSETCHVLVTLREILYARLRCSAMACRVLGQDFCAAGAPR